MRAAAAGGGADPLGNLGQLARVASQPGVSSDEAAMLQLADPARWDCGTFAGLCFDEPMKSGLNC